MVTTLSWSVDLSFVADAGLAGAVFVGGVLVGGVSAGVVLAGGVSAEVVLDGGALAGGVFVGGVSAEVGLVGGVLLPPLPQATSIKTASKASTGVTIHLFIEPFLVCLLLVCLFFIWHLFI